MPGQGYIALKLNLSQAKALHDFLAKNNFSDLITPEKMHMTLIYDKRNPDIKYEKSVNAYKADLKAIKALGTGNWRAAVLELNAPEISKRHDALINSGYKHSYDDFVPHLSIKYKPDNADIAKLQSLAGKIKSLFPAFIFSNEYAEKLNDSEDDMQNFILKSFVNAGRFAEGDKKISDFNSDEVAMGIKVEYEHTNSKVIALKIALDHLAEIPDYYTRLAKMESDAKRELKPSAS